MYVVTSLQAGVLGNPLEAQLGGVGGHDVPDLFPRDVGFEVVEEDVSSRTIFDGMKMESCCRISILSIDDDD